MKSSRELRELLFEVRGGIPPNIDLLWVLLDIEKQRRFYASRNGILIGYLRFTWFRQRKKKSSSYNLRLGDVEDGVPQWSKLLETFARVDVHLVRGF